MGRIDMILRWLFTCDDISIHYLHIVGKCDTRRIVEDCYTSVQGNDKAPEIIGALLGYS
jgi:hypothetical protein